jgi:dCMP deaminase
MKEKHKKAYMEICGVLANLSECLRTNRKYGAILVDPESNIILATGYNGYIRGGTTHCGGEGICLREKLKIKSGEKFEIGCIHAEENVLINAARQGVSTVGMWLFLNGEPCALCSRRMVQSGIKKVIMQKCDYPVTGTDILRANGVEIEYLE